MTAQNVAFGIIAGGMAVAALRMVTTRSVIHAALYLMLVLAGVATLFLLLGAEFLGWVQVLIYIGAIIVLFLFGVMLTRAPIGPQVLDNDQRWLAAIVGALTLGLLVGVFWKAFGQEKIRLVGPTTGERLGTEIFRHYVLPFEVVSVLLLAALIGAIVLARREVESPEREPEPEEAR